MKQLITFCFNEEFLPTPRCKKPRVREVDSSLFVNIRECHKEDAPLVMLVKSYDCEEREIRVFKGKLYKNVQWRDINRIGDEPLEKNETVETMNFQSWIWVHPYYNGCRWNGDIGDETTKAKIKKSAKKLLVIDGMVFEKTTEPIYNITTFGCNDSAGMFVTYADKDSKQGCNFSALEREECHNELKRILSYSREMYDNSDSYDIKVFAPEYVKFKRAKRK